MNTSAIILMLLVWVCVISLTIYFFAKILKKPGDTGSENRIETDGLGN
jgi:heme/copper-type cytochrome/quinol oxidase subunit 2